MKQQGKSLLVACIITLAAFLSVGYTACKKTETPSTNQCETVVCQNGGTCFKGNCTCPGGFEGDFCQTRAIDKYIGNWLVTEKVVGSNRQANLNKEKKYNSTISTATGSNVDFLISNFMGNDSYDNVACRMGVNAKQEAQAYSYFGFMPATIPGTQVYISKGEGQVNSSGSFITGTYICTYPDAEGIVADSLNISFER